MKQKKGKDYKMIRQSTNEDRIAKKSLRKSVKTSIIRGEFEEEKLDISKQKNENGK